MSVLMNVLSVIYVLCCIFIIVLVLLQKSEKGIRQVCLFTDKDSYLDLVFKRITIYWRWQHIVNNNEFWQNAYKSWRVFHEKGPVFISGPKVIKVIRIKPFQLLPFLSLLLRWHPRLACRWVSRSGRIQARKNQNPES